MPQDTRRPGWVPSEECAQGWWQGGNSQAWQVEEPIQQQFSQTPAYAFSVEYPLQHHQSAALQAPEGSYYLNPDLPGYEQSVPLMDGNALVPRHFLSPAPFGSTSRELDTFPNHDSGLPAHLTPSPSGSPPPLSPAMSIASMGAYHIPPSPSDATRGLDRTMGFRRDVGSEAQAAASLRRRDPEHVGDSIFQCNECDKTFTRRHNLNNHLLRHADRKQYACNEHNCASRFNTSGDLKSHIKKMH
ncbi:hypothetical protein FB107DRAFT_251245 [Schizophyllum commune]